MAEPKKLPIHNDLPPRPPRAALPRARSACAPAPYLADLNPEQRQAVETLDGPVLVLAGAGTGKTRVLTTRIAHILNLGRARPGDILAVTFTNKAAREMKDARRPDGRPGGRGHAVARHLPLHRREDSAPARRAGRASSPTSPSSTSTTRSALIKQLLAAENIDEKRWPARVLAMLIDGWKNRGLTPDMVPAGEAAAFANGKGKKLYLAYQERLKTLNAADFGDLLLENIRLFRENPDVLRQYQQRFKFILVDEYQDTNVAQYLWLRLLSQTQCASTALSPSSPGRAEGASPGDPRLAVPKEDVDGRDIGERQRRRPSARLCPAMTTPRKAGQSAQTAQKTSAASAMTTSRSTAGAAPRSITFCASTTTFPAPRSSGWSEITAAPATSSRRPRTSSRTTKAGSARRCAPRTCPAKRCRSPAPGTREEEARAIGEEIEQLQRAARERGRGPSARRDRHSGARLVPDARIRRPLHPARPALPRHRRAALLRAHGNPRRARLSARDRAAGRRPRLRAHRQCAQARARRRHRADAARLRAQARASR